MNAPSTFTPRAGFRQRFAGLFPKKLSPDLPPSLSAPKRFPFGQFQMRIDLPASREFQVETTTDLRHWTLLCSEVARTDTVEYLDPGAARFSFRFYRVRTAEGCSPNVLGYVALNLPPGFSMVANPLQHPDNTVEALFPNLPDGATLTKFDNNLFKLIKNVVAGSKWSNPRDTLLPGEGAILFNPTADFKTLGLVGDVIQGDLSVPIPAGFCIRSSMVPRPGQLDADLFFPTATNDVVHLFDRDRQQYQIYTFASGKWSPEPPVLGVGESFWVAKTQPGNWNQTLSLNSAEEEELAPPQLAVPVLGRG